MLDHVALRILTNSIAAPTNEAFAALPEGTVESLLLPENIEQLRDVLKYHVVAGLAPSSSLTSGAVNTLNGDSVTITVSDAAIIVNDAFVITADIMASNGIIHVIDTVLLPPADDGQGNSGAPASAATAVGRTGFFDTTAVVDIMCSHCVFYNCCVGSDEAPNPTKYDTCKGYLDEAQAASDLALEEIIGGISDVVSGTGGASSGFDQLIDIFGDLFEGPSGGAASQPDDSLPESMCGFCASGLDDPSFVLPAPADGATCLDAQTYALTLTEGDEMCATVKLAELLCCSGPADNDGVTEEPAGEVTEEPADVGTTAETTPPTDESTEGTIAALATTVDDLSTLVAAATAAGLVDALSGDGPFTVFGTY